MQKAFLFAVSLCWALEASYFEKVLTIANREGDGPDAVAAKLGRPLDNTRNVEVRDGVAVIPVVGPIFRRAGMLHDVSGPGMTSVQVLAKDFRAAIENPEVKSIILDIDSPGGEANGINEFAAMIRDARGTKPIVAYVGGMGASAAYWIASAADKIVANETAELGSIGTVMAVPAPDATSAKQIEIVASQSPHKRPNIATPAGRSIYQKRVDSNAEIFIADVARNRGVEVAYVLEKFGKGAVMIAKEALAVGMIDELGSLEGTIAQLAAANAEPVLAAGIAHCLFTGEVLGTVHRDHVRVAEDGTPISRVGDVVTIHLSDFSDAALKAIAESVPPNRDTRPGLARAIPTAARAAAPTVTREKPMSMIQLATVAALLGLAAGSTEEEITSSIAAQRRSREDLHKLTGKSTDGEAFATAAAWKENAEQLTRVRSELEKTRADVREGEVKSIIEAGQKAGKIPPAKVANYLQIAGAGEDGKGADPARLRALVDTLEPAVNTKPLQTPPASNGNPNQPAGAATEVSSMTDEDRKVCAQLNIDPKEFMALKAEVVARPV